MTSARAVRATRRALIRTSQTARARNSTPISSSSSPSSTSSASSSATIFGSPSQPGGVPDQAVCTHTEPCLCGSDIRPIDPSVYYNSRRNASNNITEIYLRNNLGLGPGELEFIAGFSMAFGTALRSLQLRVEQSGQRFRLVGLPDGVNPIKETIQILRDQFVIILSVLDTSEIELHDPFRRHPSEPDDVWIRTEIDLREAIYDGRNATSRAFVCLFVVPTILQIIHISHGDIERAIYSKLCDVPHQRRNYFLYLAIKSGLGSISATKKREWSSFLLSRKVDAVMQGQRGPVPVSDEVGQRMSEQDKKIAELDERHRKELVALNGGIEYGLGIREEVTAMAIEQEKKLVAFQADFRNQAQNFETKQTEWINQQNQRFEAIQNDQRTGIQEVQGLIKVHDQEITDLRDRQEVQAQELKGVQEAHAAEMVVVRKDFAAAVDSTMAHHSELVMTRMEQLLSVSRPPPEQEAVSAPSHDVPAVQLYLRIRNPSAEAEHEIDSTHLALHRAFIAGEPTDVVARAITRGISSSVPFVFGLLGYSGGGKTYTFNGLLDAILGYLPPVEITVLEVLTSRTFLKSYSNEQGLGEKINAMRKQRPTPANAVSSRAHLVVTFEALSSDIKYGMLLDIAGDEESGDRAMLSPSETLVSSEIARNNTDFRAFMQEIASPKEAPKASMFKRSCKLNSEFSAFLSGQRQTPVIRLLYCADGSRGDLVAKTLKLMPEI